MTDQTIVPDAASVAGPAALVLAIDASTYTGTVAVLRGAELLAEREVAMRGADEERLMPAVAEALAAAGVSVEQLGAVACGAGPGSFTSLRIAASIAKGIAMARGIPLFAVPSLWLVVAGARPALPMGQYVVALDAMRGDSYCAPMSVQASGGVAGSSGVHLVPASEVEAFATSRDARVVGPGQTLSVAPHARGVARLGRALMLLSPVDLDSWEPDYGRKAEAQVKWEQAHGRPLAAAE